MNRQHIAQLLAQAASLCQQARQAATRVPMKARVVLGLFLVAAGRDTGRATHCRRNDAPGTPPCP